MLVHLIVGNFLFQSECRASELLWVVTSPSALAEEGKGERLLVLRMPLLQLALIAQRRGWNLPHDQELGFPFPENSPWRHLPESSLRWALSLCTCRVVLFKRTQMAGQLQV